MSVQELLKSDKDKDQYQENQVPLGQSIEIAIALMNSVVCIGLTQL